MRHQLFGNDPVQANVRQGFGPPAGESHVKKRKERSTLVNDQQERRRSAFVVRFRFVLDPIPLLVRAARIYR